MSCRKIARLAAPFLVLLLAATAGTVQEVASADDPPAKRLYVALYARGPGFVEETGSDGQPGMGEHVEFIMGMHAADVVPLGGPLLDDDERTQVSGILYFVRAASLQEARDLAQREPMLKTRVVELLSIREFLIGVGAGRLD